MKTKKLGTCIIAGALTLLYPAAPSMAQIGIGIGMPGVSIGINLPIYPNLVRIPGYPVYYAPGVDSNYFFYDGMYWDYDGSNWYASSWYNGPWALVEPEFVPLFVLRVPVRYYRRPPAFFGGWRSDAPPRWDVHWGNDWSRSHRDWDRWNRRSVPAPAPLPVYQRRYSGASYPQAAQQHELRTSNYRYQPRETVVRQHFEQSRIAPAQRQQQPMPETRPTPVAPMQREQPRRGDRGGENMQKSTPMPETRPTPVAPMQREQPMHKGDRGGENMQKSTPMPQSTPVAPREQPPQRREEKMQRPAPVPTPPQPRAAPEPRQPMPTPPQPRAAPEQRQPPPMQREPQPPKAAPAPPPQVKGPAPDRGKGEPRGKGEDHNKGEERK